MAKGSDTSVAQTNQKQKQNSNTSASGNATYTPAGLSTMKGILGRLGETADLPYTPVTQGVAGLSDNQLGALTTAQTAYNTASPYMSNAAELFTKAAVPLSEEDINNYMNPYAKYVMDNMQEIFGRENRDSWGKLVGQAGGVGSQGIQTGMAEQARMHQLAAGQTLAGIYQNALQAAQNQQGVQQASAYGLGNLGGATLSNALQMAGFQSGIGGLEQGYAQNVLNAKYQEELARAGFPYAQTAWYAGQALPTAGMMGGTNVSKSKSQSKGVGSASGTQTMNPADPSMVNQIMGPLMMAAAFANRGGRIKGYAMGGPPSPYGGTSYIGATPDLGNIKPSVMPDVQLPQAQPMSMQSMNFLQPPKDDGGGSPMDAFKAGQGLSNLYQTATTPEFDPTDEAGWAANTTTTPAGSGLGSMFGFGAGGGVSPFGGMAGMGSNLGDIGFDAGGAVESQFAPMYPLNFMQPPPQEKSGGEGDMAAMAMKMLPYLMMAANRGGEVNGYAQGGSPGGGFGWSNILNPDRGSWGALTPFMGPIPAAMAASKGQPSPFSMGPGSLGMFGVLPGQIMNGNAWQGLGGFMFPNKGNEQSTSPFQMLDRNGDGIPDKEPYNILTSIARGEGGEVKKYVDGGRYGYANKPPFTMNPTDDYSETFDEWNPPSLEWGLEAGEGMSNPFSAALPRREPLREGIPPFGESEFSDMPEMSGAPPSGGGAGQLDEGWLYNSPLENMNEPWTVGQGETLGETQTLGHEAGIGAGGGGDGGGPYAGLNLDTASHTVTPQDIRNLVAEYRPPTLFGRELTPARLALLTAGAKTMASRSPYPGVGIGEGLAFGFGETLPEMQKIEYGKVAADYQRAMDFVRLNQQQGTTEAQIANIINDNVRQAYILDQSGDTEGARKLLEFNETLKNRFFRSGAPGPAMGGEGTPSGVASDSSGFDRPPMSEQPENVSDAEPEEAYAPILPATTFGEIKPPKVYRPDKDFDWPGGRQAMKEMNENTIKEQYKSYKSANNQMGPLMSMVKGFAKLPQDGWNAPGPLATMRQNIAKGLNMVGQMAGIKPEELPSNIQTLGIGEMLNKYTTLLGMKQTADTVGQREAATIIQANIQSVPNLEQTPYGAAIILAGLQATAKRQQDFYKYLLSYGGRDKTKAEIQFTEARPAEYYVKWADVVGKTRYNVWSGKLTKDQAIENLNKVGIDPKEVFGY